MRAVFQFLFVGDVRLVNGGAVAGQTMPQARRKLGYRPGFHLVFTWCPLGFHLSFTWVSLGFHLGFTWVSLGFRLGLLQPPWINSCQSMRAGCSMSLLYFCLALVFLPLVLRMVHRTVPCIRKQNFSSIQKQNCSSIGKAKTFHPSGTKTFHPVSHGGGVHRGA